MNKPTDEDLNLLLDQIAKFTDKAGYSSVHDQLSAVKLRTLIYTFVLKYYMKHKIKSKLYNKLPSDNENLTHLNNLWGKK